MRTTRARLLGLAAAFLVAAVVVVDLVGSRTPHPIAGPWFYSDGRLVPRGARDPLILAKYRGHDHCSWESAIFIEMGWPPGTEVPSPIPDQGPVRHFIRDPNGDVDPALARAFDAHAERPEGAEPTGFERDEWEIHYIPGDDRFIYLVGEGVVERWPSSELAPDLTGGKPRLILCA